MFSDPKSLAGRPTEKADLFGQVFTPHDIALQMAKTLLEDREEDSVKILDPCVGPFTFPNALLETGLLNENDSLTLIDIDPEMVNLSQNMVVQDTVCYEFVNSDYLQMKADSGFDYAIFNPPYIRQEWIDNKHEYRDLFKNLYNVEIPGTSNLYVYFLVKVIMDLKPGGKFSAIIYDSWKSTLYGRWLMKFIEKHCDHLLIDLVRKQPFNKRLIDATIIQGVKRGTVDADDSRESCVKIEAPETFRDIDGFAPIDSLFKTKRGLRLKQANFFLCDFADKEGVGATPFVKKVNSIKGYVVPDNHPESALLIHPGEENPLVMEEIQKRLVTAKQNAEQNVSILTWFNERPENWYVHRKGEWAPIIFNYYVRNRPRHIYNPNRVYSDNFYGISLRVEGSVFAWFAVLNATSTCVEILRNSRSQGNGLFKIQLYEYRRVNVADIRNCDKRTQDLFDYLGRKLVESTETRDETIGQIDDLIHSSFRDERLNPAKLCREYTRYIAKERAGDD